MGIGVISDRDPQPLIVGSRFGTFAIVCAGLIENLESLGTELLQEGHSFGEMTSGGINSVELVAKLINTGKDLIDGFGKMFDKIHGSATLLLLTREGIYAARDRLGRYPLVVGEKGGDFAVATESSSFLNLGFKVIKFLEPGEVVLIDKNGLKQKASGRPNSQICAFLWIYTGDPSSSYEGISVEQTRERCGRALAKGDPVEVDLVTGIPDSGIGHAIGYAMASGIPYRRPLVKYTPGYGRSYTPPSQDIRDLVATMKLIAVKDVIRESRMVVCDDSIVRGTQIKNYTIKKLWDNGAKEIHLRVACPPLMYPCRYGASTRSKTELASRKAIRALEGADIDNVAEYLDARTEKYRKMVEWIRKDLNITSLKYLSIDDMISAIGLPEKDLCLYCWRGR
jgi:amidophosphoribosyltransferase